LSRKDAAGLRIRRASFALSVVVAGASLFTTLAEANPPEAPAIHRGFNTFPWLSRARTLKGDPRQFDYDRLFPYRAQFSAAEFAALRQLGADFVRAIVEPSPFLLASPELRARLVAEVVAETKKASGAGLSVIIDLHPRGTVAAWSAQAILSHADLKEGYRATAVAFARALNDEPQGRFILELMNEPPGGYGATDDDGWRPFQALLVKAARAVAPALPLVVTGDRGGGPDGLLRLNPAALDDPGILYSFHYYLPMVVTHQGAHWTSKAWRRYVSGVAFPPAPSEAAATMARIRAAIFGDPALPEATRQKLWGEAEEALQDYYYNPKVAGSIQADFARISDWANAYHIPHSRIIVGEFGVFRPGACIDTAARWTHDVRKASEDYGFPWAFFNDSPFDENGQGFSFRRMSGPHPNEFDPRMLSEGLGLRMP